MEEYYKYNYSKPYRKVQFNNRQSFIPFKKKYNSYYYNNNEAHLRKNYKINKGFQKTTFNNIYSTEKNHELKEFIFNDTKNEVKNATIEDNSTSNINSQNKSNSLQKERKTKNNSLIQIISNHKFNFIENTSRKKMTKKNNIVNQTKNKLTTFNTNYNKKILSQSQLLPYYNSSNYNNNSNNNIYNNNNFYYKFIQQNVNNSINNYYINNNIVIYNNNQYQNLYSILNSYNIVKNMNNSFLPQNNFNNLFSKNEENEQNENNHIIIDPKKENTCILEINLKVAKDKSYNFRLNRFDDLFETVQIFCQINDLSYNLYIPIIVNIMKALNSIYGIYNMKLSKKEIDELKILKYFYLNSEYAI